MQRYYNLPYIVGNFFQIGIGQGFQPITGYNLGARRYDRIREAVDAYQNETGDEQLRTF